MRLLILMLLLCTAVADSFAQGVIAQVRMFPDQDGAPAAEEVTTFRPQDRRLLGAHEFDIVDR